MKQNERDVLRTLRRIFDQTADHITERDAMFLYKAADAVLKAMLDAEEPVNNAQVFYEKADRIIEHVEDFVAYREKENWQEESSYLYRFSESVLVKN